MKKFNDEKIFFDKFYTVVNSYFFTTAHIE